MDWLRHHMRDHLSNVRPFPTLGTASDGVLPRTAPSAHRRDALDLVQAAADVLRNMAEQSAAVETRAHALMDRASGELKAARDLIQAAEMECERLNGLVAQSKDQLLSAEKALEGAEARISALETQLAACEKRAAEAENKLMLVEDAIHSEILEPIRAEMKTLAAA